MAITTMGEYLHAMRAAFLPERTCGKHAIIQYAFSGSVSGTCYAIVHDGQLQVAQGEHPAPTVTVVVDFGLWVRILAYKEDGLIAYQDGRYQISGDVEALMDSDTWFAH